MTTQEQRGILMAAEDASQLRRALGRTRWLAIYLVCAAALAAGLALAATHQLRNARKDLAATRADLDAVNDVLAEVLLGARDVTEKAEESRKALRVSLLNCRSRHTVQDAHQALKLAEMGEELETTENQLIFWREEAAKWEHFADLRSADLHTCQFFHEGKAGHFYAGHRRRWHDGFPALEIQGVN